VKHRISEGICLHSETRIAIPNKEAAAALSLQPQTLRAWSSTGSGPIRPVKLAGRLYWRVADLLRLLEGGRK
jgi:hypothetical protein